METDLDYETHSHINEQDYSKNVSILANVCGFFFVQNNKEAD